MKMNELTLKEREFLDEVNDINLKIESNPAQSLWNVCWGYLNGKFTSSLLTLSDSEIESLLKLINSQAPRIVSYNKDNVSDAMYSRNKTSSLSPLF